MSIRPVPGRCDAKPDYVWATNVGVATRSVDSYSLDTIPKLVMECISGKRECASPRTSTKKVVDCEQLFGRTRMFRATGNVCAAGYRGKSHKLSDPALVGREGPA
jgi:hypothetical protein